MTLHRLAVVAVDLSYGSEVRSGACVAYGPRAADRAHVAEHEIPGAGKGLKHFKTVRKNVRCGAVLGYLMY